MPAPQPAELSATAKKQFSGQGIALPMRWQSMGSLYPDAFSRPELSTSSTPETNLFHEPTRNKYHTQAARILGREYEQYIDHICAAICTAVGRWMQNAGVATAVINGPVASVMPGSVLGPPLKPMIMAEAPQATPSELKYSSAIATAVSNGWARWQQGLCGMLSYPPFAAVTTATAPPTANTPVPLITWSSAGEADLFPDALAGAMAAEFDTADALHAGTLFDAVARAFHTHFQVFKNATTINNVLGTGPVPVMPGPVAAGTVIPTPGNFI